MILIKRVFCFIIAISIFISIFCFSPVVSSASGEIDADLVKGLIVSLSAISGLDFPDWTTAQVFADDFFSKIMNQQTEAQLEFLSVIAGLDYTSINSNFSAADISPLILTTFETALTSTYGISVDPDLGPLSGFVQLPKQYNFQILERAESSSPAYYLSDYIDVSSLSVGLNPIKASQGFDICFYLYFDGSSAYPIFKVGNYYVNFFSSFRFPIATYDMSSIRLSIHFVRRSYDSEGKFTESSISFDDWSGSGFNGFYRDPASSTSPNPDFAGVIYDYFTIGFSCYKSDGSRLGFLKGADSFGFHADVDDVSVIHRSSSCEYSDFDSFKEYFNGSLNSSNVDLKRLDNYNFGFDDFVISNCFGSVNFREYIFPVAVNPKSIDSTFRFFGHLFTFICLSRAFGYYDSAIGTLIHDDQFIAIDTEYLRSFDNIRDHYLNNHDVVRVPVDLDSIIADESNVGYKPTPEDVLGDYVPDLPDEPFPDDPYDPNDPELVLPDVDSSSISEFFNSFVDSIGNFFSWIGQFLSYLPAQIVYPVLGVFVVLLCLGLVKIIL